MNPIVFHIVSGDSFFSGISVMLASLSLAYWSSDRQYVFALRAARLGMLVAVILMSLSSNPSSAVCIAVLLMAFVIRYFWPSSQGRIRSITLILLLSQAGWQASYLIGKSVNVERCTHLMVIGDSIAAGMGEPESSKWPQIIAERSKLKLVDSSRPGASTSDILPLLEHTADMSMPTKTIVLIEIGGNDVLQGRSVENYRRGLASLLEKLRSSGFDRICMLELPLPPLHERFAFWQRTLARKHNVTLIPKREFLTVIASSDSTSDSLHLSTLGHQRMAFNLLRYFTSHADSDREISRFR